jgi:hypothetical protein
VDIFEDNLIIFYMSKAILERDLVSLSEVGRGVSDKIIADFAKLKRDFDDLESMAREGKINEEEYGEIRAQLQSEIAESLKGAAFLTDFLKTQEQVFTNEKDTAVKKPLMDADRAKRIQELLTLPQVSLKAEKEGSLLEQVNSNVDSVKDAAKIFFSKIAAVDTELSGVERERAFTYLKLNGHELMDQVNTVLAQIEKLKSGEETMRLRGFLGDKGYTTLQTEIENQATELRVVWKELHGLTAPTAESREPRRGLGKSTIWQQTPGS